MKIATASVTVRFEAAHRLPNVESWHKCGRIHGHNYKVVLRLTGQIDEATGMVEDFWIIKSQLNALLLDPKIGPDHRYLNEIPGLENPTAENIAVYIFEYLTGKRKLARRRDAIQPNLVAVEVWENDDVCAMYEGPRIEPPARLEE